MSELLIREDLSLSWVEHVLRLSREAVDEVELNTADSIDIRSLIKLKKIPGATADQCTVVPGEVFTHRVRQKDLVITEWEQ